MKYNNYYIRILFAMQMAVKGKTENINVNYIQNSTFKLALLVCIGNGNKLYNDNLKRYRHTALNSNEFYNIIVKIADMVNLFLVSDSLL